VLHGPTRAVGLGDADWQIWRAMEALAHDGKVRQLGVSNVSAEQLEALWRDAEVKPAFVQNRCYARDGWDGDVRALCRQHDVAYQGFSLLTANRRELGSARVRRIAERLDCTVAQLVFRFALDVGMMPLTGPAHGRPRQGRGSRGRGAAGARSGRRPRPRDDQRLIKG